MVGYGNGRRCMPKPNKIRPQESRNRHHGEERAYVGWTKRHEMHVHPCVRPNTHTIYTPARTKTPAFAHAPLKCVLDVLMGPWPSCAAV